MYYTHALSCSQKNTKIAVFQVLYKLLMTYNIIKKFECASNKKVNKKSYLKLNSLKLNSHILVMVQKNITLRFLILEILKTSANFAFVLFLKHITPTWQNLDQKKYVVHKGIEFNKEYKHAIIYTGTSSKITKLLSTS